MIAAVIQKSKGCDRFQLITLGCLERVFGFLSFILKQVSLDLTDHRGRRKSNFCKHATSGDSFAHSHRFTFRLHIKNQLSVKFISNVFTTRNCGQSGAETGSSHFLNYSLLTPLLDSAPKI
jgi:hypothetical protein